MIKKIIILVVAVIMTACSSSENLNPKVQHIVMCWLKNDAPQEEFIETVKKLSEIDEVLNVSVGRKLQSIEPVADNSFDVSFIITFKNNNDLKVYLDHPKHVSAVTEVLKPALQKVVVYDFQEI